MSGSSTTGGVTEEGSGAQPIPAAVDIFVDALQGAMALVHADGGEIATFDPVHQVLVSRARITHPNLDQALGHGSLGGRAGQSAYNATRPGASRPAPDAASPREIDAQTTMALRAGPSARVYRLGEGLIGLTGQRREPIILGREQYREMVKGTAHTDTDAHWHLAVPMFRPGPLAALHANTGLAGVIVVYNRDPHWSFTQRESELLTLHADRVARSLAMADLRRRTQLEIELFDVLHEAGGPAQLQELFRGVRDLVRRVLDAPTFALLRAHVPGEVTYEVAERDGVALAPFRIALHRLPAWWPVVSHGTVVRVSTHDEHAAYPQYCLPGFGGDQPVQSLLAAPLQRGAALMGAIVVGSPRPDVYGDEEAQMLEAVGRAAALALENARLAQTPSRLGQLHAVNNAVLKLNDSLNLDKTLETLADSATLVTTAPQALVFLLDDTGKRLILRARNRRPTEEQRPMPDGEITLPLDWHNLREALDTGQFLLRDRLEDEWRQKTPMARFLAEEQIASCAVFPIIYRVHQPSPNAEQPPSKPLGILLVHTPKQRSPFPPQQMSREMGQLQSLASAAATAVRNAMLYRDLEHALEAQKELDRLKDEFVLTISHEFRTPLTTIDGYVSLIDKHKGKLDEAKLGQFASEIKQAVQQLAGMISMLADANRLASQPLQVTLGPVNLYDAATRALSTQSPEARARVRLDIPPDLAAFADPDRLPLIFSNLIGNAIKYAPEKPIEVTARVESREALARTGRKHPAATQAAARWVVVSVRDRGPGIAPEDMDKLFQKFVRLSRSLTTSVRGTGLGLCICREYMEAMGGDIWVESAVNAGSNFQFCLPVALTAGGKRGG